MKKNKITLALSSILLSVSLVGCSSGDGLNRSAKDGKENEVEKASIKLVKATKTGDYNLISADELKKSIDSKEDMILINTIPSDRFEKTKIKGAVNAGLPKEMKDLKPEEKEAFLKTLGSDKDKKIVIYCGFVACERSHVGAVLAKEAGYKNVYRFPGGIAAWLDAGNSIDK
ncbi:rhodanese-like domain-containing protein [Gemella haemolysans]|uniref:rhodanese-like domain-containing protein n=1 Tax=Gemella haemolysans TaxID=1379 RepID=UPI001958E30B|nr:rhodanese-like domain-containing protein [Gemella haemolysans]VTX73318.1 Rhodanese-like domain protein [Gemella haemolysans]